MRPEVPCEGGVESPLLARYEVAVDGVANQGVTERAASSVRAGCHELVIHSLSERLGERVLLQFSGLPEEALIHRPARDRGGTDDLSAVRRKPVHAVQDEIPKGERHAAVLIASVCPQ